MAQVRWIRTLALAATLGGLALGVCWLELKHKPAKEALEEKSKKLLQTKDTSVKTITLKDGNKTTTLSCLDFASNLCKPGDQSKWEVAEPLKAKADDSNANALLSTLSNTNIEHKIDLKGEKPEKRAALLKDYGLDPQARKSARTVSISSKSETTTLYLGAPHPIGDSFFVLEERTPQTENSTGKPADGKAETEGTTVYVVGNSFKTSLDHDLKYWRDKKLTTLSAPQIQGFDLMNGSGKISALRKDGQWTLKVGPKEDLMMGDTENIDQYLSTVIALRAKEFAGEKADSAAARSIVKGLKPAFTLTLHQESAVDKAQTAPAAEPAKGTPEVSPPVTQPVTMTFYSKQSKLYATVSNLDPLFELDLSSKDRLNKTANDLRMTKLVSNLERFTAQKVLVSGSDIGPSPMVIAKIEGKWRFQPENGEVDESKVTQSLDRLSGSKIRKFLTDVDIPGEKDGIHFTLESVYNSSSRQLVIWKHEKNLYARDLQSPRKEILQLDASLESALPWKVDFFKKVAGQPEAEKVAGSKPDTTNPMPPAMPSSKQ